MITYLLITNNTINLPEILGYILIGLEVAIVICLILKGFFPKESKIGRVLSQILKGLYNAKDITRKYPHHKDKDKDEGVADPKEDDDNG